MSECLFCKIINKEIPGKVVYEDENILAFEDISPMANTHLLFISKKHTQDINEMTAVDSEGLASLFFAITAYTTDNNIESFRLVNNLGADAGQTVFHTHVHLLAGEKLGKFGRP